MEFTVLKLGTTCVEKATGLKGTLTHWVMNMDKKVDYLFQPEGLDEYMQPLRKLYLCEKRLQVESSDFEVVEVPFEILGTQATHTASGFTGMVVEFIRHINGCFHLVIQSKGKLQKTGLPIQPNDFDMRELQGEMIPVFTPEEKTIEDARRPSPSSVPPRPGYN